jgi:hypothetical protein
MSWMKDKTEEKRAPTWKLELFFGPTLIDWLVKVERNFWWSM